MEGTLTLSRFVESLNITESFGLGLISPPVDLWWQGPLCGKDPGCGMGGWGGGEGEERWNQRSGSNVSEDRLKC